MPYLQTQSDINNGEPVSLFRFIDSTKILSIRDFTSTYNAAPAVQTACNSGAKHLDAGYGLFNLESSVVASSSMALEGTGDGTVFTQRNLTGPASFVFKSANATSFIEGIRLRNFVMQCLTGTFAEHEHLIAASGVRNALFEGLRMYGFRGDGIYLGSGAAGEERHNQNVRVVGCVFDGINRANRNAITVIDGDGITIENCVFLRCSQANMPGPIDFEPNRNAWHVVRNILIRRNRFRSNGGNVGEIAMVVPAAVVTSLTNVVIDDNDSEGYVGTGSFYSHNTYRVPTDASPNTALLLKNNRAINGSRPWSIFDGKGIQLEGNTWSDMKQAALVGYTGALNLLRSVSITNDQYTRVGTMGGVGLAVFSVVGLKLQKADFTDCGTGKAGSYAISFNKGASSSVEFSGVNVSAPTGKTLAGIQKEGNHTFNAATNAFLDSDLHGLKNSFQAHIQTR